MNETTDNYTKRAIFVMYLHLHVNKQGKIIYTHFGDGDYAQTETTIQKLLKDAG